MILLNIGIGHIISLILLILVIIGLIAGFIYPLFESFKPIKTTKDKMKVKAEDLLRNIQALPDVNTYPHAEYRTLVLEPLVLKVENGEHFPPKGKMTEIIFIKCRDSTGRSYWCLNI